MNCLPPQVAGRFPVFVVVAVLKAIKEYFGLDWEIEWQK